MTEHVSISNISMITPYTVYANAQIISGFVSMTEHVSISNISMIIPYTVYANAQIISGFVSIDRETGDLQ